MFTIRVSCEYITVPLVWEGNYWGNMAWSTICFGYTLYGGYMYEGYGKMRGTTL